jgi:hypothetical protein
MAFHSKALLGVKWSLASLSVCPSSHQASGQCSIQTRGWKAEGVQGKLDPRDPSLSVRIGAKAPAGCQ